MVVADQTINFWDGNGRLIHMLGFSISVNCWKTNFGILCYSVLARLIPLLPSMELIYHFLCLRLIN